MKKHRTLRYSALAAIAATLLPASAAVAQMDLVVDLVVNGGNTYNWQKVTPAGAVCGNGSQYKFWYYDSPTSNNMVIMFEGGGACWDYDTCSGRAGVLGASNPNGLPDNYIYGMAPTYVSPIINGADPGLPFRSKRNIATNGWDVVYMPYCTGDVHTGNATQTYVDQTGANPPLVWRHNGFNNSVAAANFLRGRFPSINKMLVTGFSAGGVGTATQYHTMRRTLLPTKGYSLNDSGPLFPAPNSTYKSWLLHKKIESSWNLASVYSQMPTSFSPADFGTATRALATQYPADLHAYTGYSSDYNFSRFSYERFYPNMTEATILAYWRADQANFVNQMNLYANFSYHIPWHRPINVSHCSTIITFVGSHACKSIRKKYWYEYVSTDPWQTWKCTSGFTPFETFFDAWVNSGTRSRIVEKENYYNNEDAGMAILNTLVSAAL